MLRSLPGARLRTLPVEAAVNVKDRLRDIRDFLREHRHDQPGSRAPRRGAFSAADGQFREMLGHMVSVVDDALTLAEGMSAGLLPRVGNDRLWPQALTVYFPSDGEAWLGERAFRRDMYAAAKRASLRAGLDPQGAVRESVFSAAHKGMYRRHRSILATLGGPSSDRLRPVAAIVAAVAHELQRAVRTEARWRSVTASHEGAFVQRCLPGLLASGLATLDPEAARRAEFFELALLATEARGDRIAAGLAETSPKALAEVLAGLLSRLA